MVMTYQVVAIASLIALVLIVAGIEGNAALGGAGLLVLIVAVLMGYLVVKYRPD